MCHAFVLHKFFTQHSSYKPMDCCTLQELGNRTKSLKFFLLQILSKTLFVLQAGTANGPDHV